jgi:hypothetical protein
MSREEFIILCEAENIILQLQSVYPRETTLMNPNTGEVITGEDFAETRRVLGFLTENRVVEVSP